MKMMRLTDKSMGLVGFFPNYDLAQIMAKRLDLKEFELVPADVKHRTLEPHEVHGDIDKWE